MSVLRFSGMLRNDLVTAAHLDTKRLARQKRKEYLKAWRAARVADGYCAACWSKPTINGARCESCRLKHNERELEIYRLGLKSDRIHANESTARIEQMFALQAAAKAQAAGA